MARADYEATRTNTTTTTEYNNTSGSDWLGALLVAIAVIALAYGAYSWYKHDHKRHVADNQNQSSNINNNGTTNSATGDRATVPPNNAMTNSSTDNTAGAPTTPDNTQNSTDGTNSNQPNSTDTGTGAPGSTAGNTNNQ